MSNYGILLQQSDGEWISHRLSSPIRPQIGDFTILDGDRIKLVRGGIVIAERTFDEVGLPITSQSHQVPETITELLIFRRFKMAAINSVLTNVTPTPGVSGSYDLTLSDGSGRTFTVDQMESARNKFEGDIDTHFEFHAANLIARNPTLENVDAANGTMLAINFAADTPVVLTRNE